MSFKKMLVSAAIFMASANVWAAKVTSIDFKDEGGFSTIEIKADGPISYDKQENTEDKQLVLDLKGASLSKQASRILDTSSFNSRVTLVSPYSVDDNSRIVIQLRDMAAANLSQEGNTIRVKFSSPSGKAETAATDNPPEPEVEKTAKAESKKKQSKKKIGESEPTPLEEPTEPEEIATEEREEIIREPAPAPARRRSNSVSDQLDQFLETRETKHFIGRPITLQVRNADLVDVFRLIGEASGFNILIGDGVAGQITLSLTDVPWDQALDVVLRTKHLGAERSNNLLRVVTLASLTNEKREELAAKLAAEANAPRIVRIFPISYAKLGDIQALLTKFAQSPQAVAAQQAGAGTPAGVQPVVSADERTNSLIIRDTPENIERVRKLIEVLDTQTPQILIEGKVVEASETYARNISGAIGSSGQLLNGGQTGSNFGASFAGASTGAFSLPTSSGTTGSANGALGISPYTGFLPAFSRVNASLALAETENKVKIISSPRAVVLNKGSASILQSTPIAVQQSTTANGVTTITTNFVPANLSLTVSPTVTNDSGVLMQASLSRDAPGAAGGVSNRNITTSVIVPSGNTLVLGGIYTAQANEGSDGFPWLRKIPILGALFGNSGKSTNRAELLFFITPRILNSAAAGLTGGEGG